MLSTLHRHAQARPSCRAPTNRQSRTVPLPWLAAAAAAQGPPAHLPAPRRPRCHRHSQSTALSWSSFLEFGLQHARSSMLREFQRGRRITCPLPPARPPCALGQAAAAGASAGLSTCRPLFLWVRQSRRCNLPLFQSCSRSRCLLPFTPHTPAVMRTAANSTGYPSRGSAWGLAALARAAHMCWKRPRPPSIKGRPLSKSAACWAQEQPTSSVSTARTPR